MGGLSLQIAGASRPIPGETQNGDGWRVDWRDGSCRVTVIDGVGHGREAAQISTLALEVLADQPNLDPVGSLRLCHQALLGTRGAVISVAVIELNRDRLVYAGVGNVEARLWQPDREQRPIAYRGIVGGPTRTIRAFEFSLGRRWLLVMHTDGVSDRFEVPGWPLTEGDTLEALAQRILDQQARPTDDASVVLVAPVM